jgi:steroid delta-isomerase-like uncharacterized protein
LSVEENRAIVRRYYAEVLGSGNLRLLIDLAIPGYHEHDPLPGQTDGREGLRQRVEMLRSAFQPHYTLEDVIAEGDRVVVRWTNHGTHVGEFMGLPPTGKSFAIAGIDIHRLEDGKLAEHWHVVDLFSLLQQLGQIPQPEQVPAS